VSVKASTIIALDAAAVSLRLYIAAGAPNSIIAEANLRQCSMPIGALVEVIDLLIDRARGLEDSIIVTPTLIRLFPEPRAILIGDLGDPVALAQFLAA
jgi:hypothetical protein